MESTSDEGEGEGEGEGEVPGQELIRELREVPFFAELGSRSLVKVIPALQERRYPKGSKIVTQGEEGDSFYIIRSGNAGVLLEREGKPGVALAQLGPHDGFGEMALLTDETRSATVVSTTDVEAWRLARDAFQELLAENISLSLYFNRLLTKRLRSLEDKIRP